MKKLKLLVTLLILAVVAMRVNPVQYITPASAQEFPNFDELTEVEESEAASVKYSKPKDDTRVTESDPRVNYGKSKYLAAGRWKKGKVESFIKFKTRNGYHATKLYIYLVSGKSSGLTVYSSSRNWDEKKVTWKNRPSKGTKLDSTARKSGSWWEFDVSKAKSSGGEYSFAITGPSNKIVNFYSKEGKRAPRLAFEKGSEKTSTPKPTNKTNTPRPSSSNTANPTNTSNPTNTANPTNTSNPTQTANPTETAEPTDEPTAEPSPTCDPGLDCSNDGDPGQGGIEIDESDDGAEICDPGIDCGNDGEPTTAPTCAPGIDCGNDGGSPTPRPSATASFNPPPPPGGTGSINPTPNTKIAFIGDTGDGNNFQGVLNLIKAEGAQAVIHSGDLSYSSSASTFISKINATLGADYPYFMGQGNHDTGSWSQYTPRIPSQYIVAGDKATANYAVNFNGVYIAFGKDKIGTPSTFSQDLKLATVQNVWKVCSFHEVHRAMHTGYKDTEIPYSVYDECRIYGAMTTNGHAHTYSRTRTLTSASGQTVDPAWQDSFNVRVARGAFFDLHSGAGGKSTGTWERCRKTTDASDVSGGKCDIFANRDGAVITRVGSPYGAAFITYGVDGNPRKATGYYKEVGSSTHIDDWTITAQ